MEIDFQLLDADYMLIDNQPLIRLFGKTKDDKTIAVFVKKYFPYFYVLPKRNSKEDLVDFLKANFSSLISNIKEVEKFLPIGFQTEKVKILKITLKDPSQVPTIRDSIQSNKFVQEIFEADILFKYRFMSDHGISSMKWYKVVGENSKTTTVKTNKTVFGNSITELADDTYPNFRYLSVDIEVIPSREGLPDAKRDPIAIISLSFHPGFEKRKTLILVAKLTKRHDDDVLIFKNETEMLEEFVRIIDRFDPDIITGYNVNGFDLPYILTRLEECKVSRIIGRCNQKLAMTKKIGAKYKNSITGRVVVDVYELIKESVGKGLLRLKRYGLGDVSSELINEGKVDIAHGEIAKYWNGSQEENKKLIDYARQDSQLVLKLLLEKAMLDKFVELSKVSGLLLQDVLDGGEATRVENLLLREFNKEGYVIPNKPADEKIYKSLDEREAKGLKGALVLEPKIGLFTNPVVYLDFKAMYPSIFIAYNICPTTLLLEKQKIETIKTPYGTEFVSKNVKVGVFPRLVQYLIDERDVVKEQMKTAKDETERKILDAKQYALKTMANAFYGYTGYIRAKLYILDVANAITSCGRFLIQKTREIVERDKIFEVIYGDTDSIMVKTNVKDIGNAFQTGSELEKRINEELVGIVQMKIESIFKTLLILSKKRYAGLSVERVNGSYNEKIIMKGIETIRRDWCDLTSETLYSVLNIILKEQDPKKAYNYVRETLSNLETNKIPVEKLVITKSVSKPLREYKGIQPHVELLKKLKKRYPSGAPGVGDRIGFVIVQGLQLMSDRAEDPEYIKQKNLKIDSRYYIESQLLPPLERVFEAMGITKSELIGLGRQMLLTDAIKNGVKKSEKEFLTEKDGLVCTKCEKTYVNAPMVGKCSDCGGELLFYSGNMRSRYLAI